MLVANLFQNDAKKVPGRIVASFSNAMRLAGGSEARNAFLERIGVEQADMMEDERETTRSGNCLYDAVAIRLGNPDDAGVAFRRLATSFIVENAHIPALVGLDVDNVVHTLSTPGAWAGDGGDLAPVVLASVIQRRLVIVTSTNVYEVEPFGPTAGDPVLLYLHGGHYTVNPVTPEQLDPGKLPQKTIKVEGKPKQKEFYLN
ncbi:MAG TPA: hypothetical protein VM890_03490, partial [Longimicrobium sp.]|jgi:hypothetical protein|nr:hypothetical protein [Longimicrobium sp.]